MIAPADNAVHLLLGDCFEVMPTLAECSVDSIVTDPPYGLSFMGKDWDHGIPGVHFWQEALRVAKPGAHLLAFGGTRTYHRLACAIEDAGWEIRDCVMWVYGCLSEDTEVLTKNGWERYHKARYKEILAYDPQADAYQWETPERWSAYHIKQDAAYRIESDQTDQIVSRNHRCLVERGGSLVFVAAEELAGVERVPYLQGDISVLPQGRGTLLLEVVLRQGEGLAEAARGKRQREEASWQGAGWSQEPGMEGRADVLHAKGQVRRPVDQVRSLPDGVHGHGPQGRLRHGASSAGGDGYGAVAVAERVRASRQPRRDGQPTGESDAVCVERGSQAARTRPSYRTTLATVTAVEYTGLIFCPTVSTGAFVARRNGKVFITGNSGFPKSHDVSKAIDKAAGAKREVIAPAPYTRGKPTQQYSETRKVSYDCEPQPITAPATPAAAQWSGWGTALKPAWEPIILARKPLEGTVAENVLTHGTGAMNIDASRIPTDAQVDDPRLGGNGTWGTASAAKNVYEGGYAGERVSSSPLGRWPANLIHDGSEEVVGLFPVTTSGKPCGVRNTEGGYSGKYGSIPVTGIGDSGSAARFFYCAKASKADREQGCEGLEAGRGGALNMRTDSHSQANGMDTGPRRNHHPTVKPTDLMRYLCRLITPPGGVVLDPFMGSGSTGKAALLEGFQFIGIEQSAEYFEIAKKRICNERSKTALLGATPKIVQRTFLEPAECGPR